jgi:hypothetical protein
MRDRFKWILVGLGFTFGLQVLISLVYTLVATDVAAKGSDVGQTSFPVIAFALGVGAFLIGGFVIGWMSQEMRLVDALIVAAITMALLWLGYTLLPAGNKGQLLTIDILHGAGQSAAFILLGFIASAIGAYWGWHVTVPQEGMLDRMALLIGLVGAVVGPFALLALGGRDSSNPNAQSIPWYFLVIVLALVIGIVGVGFYLFTRETSYEDEISISPEHRRNEEVKG